MTTFSESDVLAIIADSTKVIEGDIVWQPHPTAPPALQFIVEVNGGGALTLTIAGWLNPATEKLTFALIARGVGRVYGLDFGRKHPNPDGEMIGETHKHRWTIEHRDRWAYVPTDITADWSDPVTAWQQFCAEANLSHAGTMVSPNR